MKLTLAALAVAAGLAAGRAVPAPAACADLASIKLPGVSIATADPVDAGKLTVPNAPPELLSTLPALCRVTAILKPSADSDIHAEVWLPANGWNGKFLGVGNGGWAGSIDYPQLAAALRRGYAAAGSDTGHTGSGGDATFALGHPEKLIDFGWRAVHETTVAAKAIVSTLYGRAPSQSYWNGCSTGGKQGLTEAQRFPADYDGIVAGAPANYWTHLMASGVWIGQATLKDPASRLSREKFALIHRAALEACDAADGARDGLIDDPTRCAFDPGTLACAGEDAPACLTPPQVAAARKIYGGPKNPRTGSSLFPGLEPGSELGWGAMAGGPDPFPITASYFAILLFKNPQWDFRTLDFDRDVALADRTDAAGLNAIDPDLRRFAARGGKLLLYHGWADPLIAPRNTIDYYKSVRATMGAGVDASVRLFMAPGAGHCSGGEGPSVFDAVGAIEQWVEHKQAPDRLIASQRNRPRTRPLCPYPQTARYAGAGSIDDAASFTCR